MRKMDMYWQEKMFKEYFKTENKMTQNPKAVAKVSFL